MTRHHPAPVRLIRGDGAARATLAPSAPRESGTRHFIAIDARWELCAGHDLAGDERPLLTDSTSIRLIVGGDVRVAVRHTRTIATTGCAIRMPAGAVHAFGPATTRRHSFLELRWLRPLTTGAGIAPCMHPPAEWVCRRVPPGIAAQAAAVHRSLTGATSAATASDAMARQAVESLAEWAGQLPARSAGADHDVPAVQRALSLLRSNACGPCPNLDELASVAGLSKFHFLRLFAATVGTTPHRYLQLVRIEQARRLLGRGDGIAHVAQEVGFSDQSHFTRCFRDIVGIPPGRYRREVGGDTGNESRSEPLAA